MARTITPGRTWRDLPPSPPVGDQPPEAAPPPPPEPPAQPEPRNRGWWAALALAVVAALAVAAVWLLTGDSDATEVVGEDQPPPVVEDPPLPPEPGDLPEGLREIIPDELEPLLPPDLLDDLGPLFEGRDFPDGFGFLEDLPELEERFRRFFDEFGAEIPQFDFEEFFGEGFNLDDFEFEQFFPGPDFSFEFGDGRFGLGYVPEGYRVAGSSAGANSEGGDVEAEITVQLVGPQGPVTIRAEVGGDAAAKLADAPGEPVGVRGSEGKLSSEGLSFTEGDVFVTISPPGHLPDDELVRIADGLELGR